MKQPNEVAVIIAAFNCSRTIGRAVSSALSQPEVKEVIVVDDASTDETGSAARRADDGSDRLTILRQKDNRGPAAARNRGIETAQSGYIAILDSDDYFLPKRFAPLFEIAEWDLIADNVVFVSESADPDTKSFAQFDPDPAPITLTQFVAGNISRPDRPRAELGFIKPVICREFLSSSGLHYDETLRLGEDFALYALMLAGGAKFKRSRSCGYVAIERADSLSGLHRTQDLEALLSFDEQFIHHPDLSRAERAMVQRHLAQILSKVHHRRVLDKRQESLIQAVAVALASPRLLPQLALSVARDKMRARISPETKEVRYLFN